MGLYWIPIGLSAALVATAAVFFALYLATQEHVPLDRARRVWRWGFATMLATFDWWIFARVFAGLRALIS